MTGRVIILTLSVLLLAGAPVAADTCDGACGGQSDGYCYCDLNCVWFDDCCDDICDFCAEFYPVACGLPCEPAQTCDELGLTCGKIIDCWWVPDFCGTCGEGDYCNAGICVLNPCDEPSDIPGCFGICEQGSWLFDNICNTKFNCAEMNWDGGDCEPCAPTCGEQSCGLDPACGILCGVCGEGTVCTEEGICVVCGCGDAVCGVGPCGEECGTCDDGFLCEEGACVEEPPDCVAVCDGHCGGVAGCDCGDCEDGYECSDTFCELINGIEDVITGEDVVGSDADSSVPAGDVAADGAVVADTTGNDSPGDDTPGEDTLGTDTAGTDTAGGDIAVNDTAGGGIPDGGRGGGCSTAGRSRPLSILPILVALLIFAVGRCRNVLVYVYDRAM